MKKLLLLTFVFANCMPSIDDELEQLFADEVEVQSGNLNLVADDEADNNDDEVDEEELEAQSSDSEKFVQLAPEPEKNELNNETQADASTKKLPANKKPGAKVRRESNLFQKIGNLFSRGAKATGRGISCGFNSTLSFCKKHPRAVAEATFAFTAISTIATLAHKLNKQPKVEANPVHEFDEKKYLKKQFNSIISDFENVCKAGWDPRGSDFDLYVNNAKDHFAEALALDDNFRSVKKGLSELTEYWYPSSKNFHRGLVKMPISSNWSEVLGYHELFVQDVILAFCVRNGWDQNPYVPQPPIQWPAA